MNNHHTTSPVLASIEAVATTSLQAAGIWPPEASLAWRDLAQPIYAGMDRAARFAAATELRAKAKAGTLSASEHLLYALLKGKSPFRVFSALVPRKSAAGRLAWGGLLEAARAVSRQLRKMPELDEGIRQCLRQLLVLVQTRALGMSMHALKGNHPALFRELMTEAMQLTPQGSSSVTKHCEASEQAFVRLASHLKAGQVEALAVPAWMATYQAELAQVAQEHGALLRQYLAWHDCGKPFCLTYDEAGRPHFPGHAAVSARVWVDGGGSVRAAGLMAQDMDLHVLRAEEAEDFARRPDAALLLLAGVASLHANAADFGGTESDSFKIKFKRLSSRGQRICEVLFGAREAALSR